MRLKDKVAIITGGGFGIGKAITLAFASEGAVVVLASRNFTNLKNVANEIKSKGGQATAIETDVSNENQVKEMVSRTLSEYGRIDILVNNSGIGGPTTDVADMNLDDWNETLAIDLTGAMLCSREVLKDMIPRQSGNIINISSRAGKYCLALRSPYTTAKMGLIGFTETLSMEVGKYTIRVNCVAPGAVGGKRTDSIIKATSKTLGVTFQEVSRQLTDRVSLRRFISPEEIAGPAVFLASDEASAITGQTLVVDGGTICLAPQYTPSMPPKP